MGVEINSEIPTSKPTGSKIMLSSVRSWVRLEKDQGLRATGITGFLSR